mmetsp:Transcript_43878/g.121984  ORF Transcript_43878/g.121984 Transcript_43878/m.121984 type:complete len:223 (+) Transcript_43878:989-1657(+)
MRLCPAGGGWRLASGRARHCSHPAAAAVHGLTPVFPEILDLLQRVLVHAGSMQLPESPSLAVLWVHALLLRDDLRCIQHGAHDDAHVGVEGLTGHHLQAVTLFRRCQNDLVRLLRKAATAPCVQADASGVFQQGHHQDALSVHNPRAEVARASHAAGPERKLQRCFAAVNEREPVPIEVLTDNWVSLASAFCLAPLHRAEDPQVAIPGVHGVPPGQRDNDWP